MGAPSSASASGLPTCAFFCPRERADLEELLWGGKGDSLAFSDVAQNIPTFMRQPRRDCFRSPQRGHREFSTMVTREAQAWEQAGRLVTLPAAAGPQRLHSALPAPLGSRRVCPAVRLSSCKPSMSTS